MSALQIGSVVLIHSLVSEQGKIINGSRGILLESVVDGDGLERYQVRVEEANPGSEKKIAIKPQHLKAVRRLPLPSGQTRGCVTNATRITSPLQRARILAENLVRRTDGYSPSEVMFMGEAANRFMSLGGYPDSFGHMSCDNVSFNTELSY
jgi:hypothetical protein